MSPGNIPRIGENGAAVTIDWRVLAFTLAISLLTGILFGLFPAIGASRPDLNSTLKESSKRAGTGFHQSKARSLLVISEISLALVLLIGAALLIRTLIAIRHVNPGFDANNVLTMEMSLTGDRFQKTAGVAQLVRNGRERLNSIPGVEASARCIQDSYSARPRLHRQRYDRLPRRGAHQREYGEAVLAQREPGRAATPHW